MAKFASSRLYNPSAYSAMMRASLGRSMLRTPLSIPDMHLNVIIEVLIGQTSCQIMFLALSRGSMSVLENGISSILYLAHWHLNSVSIPR